MFVGDFGDRDITVIKQIKKLSIPKAAILGNHDHGRDGTGEFLRAQVNLLGDIECSWKLKSLKKPPLSIVGARPCSPGGGFYLSKEVSAVFGNKTVEESAEMIYQAAMLAPINDPLIILAHSGPTGLGSDSFSLCGRDWKIPSCDWGDNDLMLAIKKIHERRNISLVTFGHTHHTLKRGNKKRNTFFVDNLGILYLNTASVPRKGKNYEGVFLHHFSWVEFKENKVHNVSHRWYTKFGELAYVEELFSEK